MKPLTQDQINNLMLVIDSVKRTLMSGGARNACEAVAAKIRKLKQ